ncbi:TSUP family transporter [Desulfovibrio sp. OttesenSCG-928-A18]|nr:TSUP family transporter [Desulfovibrio sp. OttesenSCG-928-A18]
MEALDPLHLGFMPLLFLVAAGFFAGLVDSIAGGGGLISLPACLLAGLPTHMALGTGKFMSTVGTTASFLTYARGGAIVWRIAAIGVGFCLLGSMAGTHTALLVDNELLGKIILFLLPVAALLTFIPVRRSQREYAPGPVAIYVLTPLLCSAIGFYDGFFGPGAGSFMLISLHFVLGMSLIKASATAKCFNLASNVSSLVLFLLNGKVYFFFAVPMAIGNVSGNIVGSRMAMRVGAKLIRGMLLFSLVLLFATLVWRYYG